ncbi:mitochondrial fusion protein [Grosmannia clavigera kw1407]|uniref:Mitochondrial fusion protein n=1 Tax=Grosmannia clavigera (strain kw1407 / UAMH 11150) TaxID=655863 RepID=F0XNW0_GROCL|nr:mitochondrial fusion protein [Grosmannia clavigera kw1407]EFX00327.1 mitochondrial fusion protein [Grosmannia clavigera kw1407]
MFADIDYKEYLADPSPSAMQSVRDVVDDLIWRYTSVLMAQPFEVARTILQVRSHDDVLAVAVPDLELAKQEITPSYESVMPNSFAGYDSDLDEPNYFAPNVPNPSSTLYPAQRQRSSPSLPPSQVANPTVPLPSYRLELQKANSIVEVISQLWQKEAAWGVWKGTNASFLYTVVQSLLENWSRSLLSALFNVPDLGLKDDVDRLIDIASPYPWASLFVAAAAAVTTGLVLSPLDLVRTRLICTPTYRQPRRALSLLRNLPSLVCSPALAIPTILHSLIHPLLTLSTPLILRSQFSIDRVAYPFTFSVAKFCSSSFALFVKLPLETVLRRGQAAILNSPEYVQALEPAPTTAGSEMAQSTGMETIVPLGKYMGIFGTMYHIVSEEGRVPVLDPLQKIKPHSRKAKTKVAQAVYRQGQGMEGLWRGWKVSWWGLVGLWTAATIGHGGDGEF